MRIRKTSLACLALGGLLGTAGLAGAQQGPQLAPSQPVVTVVAGQTSAPIAVRVTEPAAARATRTYSVVVSLPSALTGQVVAQPATLSIVVSAGQTQGQSQLRFATQPTAPVGSWVVTLATADGRLVSRVSLEIRHEQQPPPGGAPPERERLRGSLQLTLTPDRLDVCDGGDPAAGTIQLRGVDGYDGRPTLRWERPPAGIFATTQMLGLDPGPPDVDIRPSPDQGQEIRVPPDRRIPFEVSARGAASGTHTLTIVGSDAERRIRVEARTRAVVRTPDFTTRATPSAVSIRQGGPQQAVALTIDPNECFGNRPIRLVAAGVPQGVDVEVPAGPIPSPYRNMSVRVRATPNATTGRHTLRLVLADASAGGRVRQELQIPVLVEPPGPRELARAPRIERVEPATLAPGERATLELTGRNLGPGVTLEFEPGDLRIVSPPIFFGPTRATVEVEVLPNTRTGFRTLVAADSSGRFEGPARLRIEIDELVDRPEEPEEAPEDEPEPQDEPGDVVRLDFGGFILTVTSTTDADLDSFAGEGVLEEFVFAGRLQTNGVDFEFEQLALEPTATAGLYEVVSGEALFDRAVNLSLPAGVAGLKVQLQGMVLRPDEARIDGQIFLPFDVGGGVVDDVLQFGDDGDDGGDLPDGFAVIPGVVIDGIMPIDPGTGGAVLTYGGTPVTGGGASVLVAQVINPDAGFPAGGFDIQAEEGAPVGRVSFSDQPFAPDGDFLYQGLVDIEKQAIGQSGVAFKAQQGLSVLVDLSQGENQNQPAINSAYLAWDVPEDVGGGMGIGLNFGEAGSPPGTPHTSPQWMGLVFLDAELAAGAIGIDGTTSHVAWVAAGFQSLLARSFGGASEEVTAHGWDVELLNTALGIKNSILIDAGALGNIHLPFFDEPLRVSLKMTNGGTPHMKALGSVAHLYGHAAVIGEGAGFFRDEGNADELKLGFTDAYWAFNGNLEAPALPSKPGGIKAFVSNQGPQTDLEFLKANYQRKFHLKQLTLRANGAADLNGETERSLASVPQLDFLDYPFLDGGAHILLEQQGSTYTLGLEGNLELAGNLGGIHAATRYQIQNGEEKIWTFDGGIDATVKVVHLDLDVAGEVDLATRDVFFNATGEFSIEQLFSVEGAGAFGREGSTRYWFVYAALDFEGNPIIETPFVSFFSFKGGVAHNLGVGQSGTCGILDPIAFAQNADQCVDGAVDWTFLAGTVLAPSEGLGGDNTVHIDGTLMVSTQGSVDILGQAWMLRSFNEGYGGGATPQAAAHVGVDANRFVMTACVGPSGTSQGAPASANTISCEGLEPLKYPKSPPVIEIRGWTGFLIDWTNDTYYLALGHYGNRVEARLFGLTYRQGYLILAYTPSVPAHWLPPEAPAAQAGFYVGRATGYQWNFHYGWSGLCQNNWVDGGIEIGSEMNLALQLVPFWMHADVYYGADLYLGVKICGQEGSLRVAGEVNASVEVSESLGKLAGGFSGKVLACGSKKCLVIVKIPNVNIDMTLWQA